MVRYAACRAYILVPIICKHLLQKGICFVLMSRLTEGIGLPRRCGDSRILLSSFVFM